MKTLNKLVLLILIISGFSLVSASVQSEFDAKASKKVKDFVLKHNIKLVGFDEVNKAVGKGIRKTAKALILDARPIKKYQINHIPTSLALPDTKFEKMYQDVLKGVAKNKEIITFCGGYKCVKSPKLALYLMEKGYTNVKVYAAGMPDWKSKSYGEMSIEVAKKMFDKGSAIFIDARPNMKFKKATITGSINIPDKKFDQYKDQLPKNMKKPLITFCGGYKCAKSHNVAKKLRKMGYKKVFVYSGGEPEWKKAKYPRAKGGATAVKVTKKSMTTNALKAGADTGSVDGNWFVANYKKLPKSVTIVNVMSKEEFNENSIPGSVNIHAEEMTPQQLLNAIPKKGEVVFYCGTGTRGMEAWGMLAEDLKYKGINRIKYLDANVECVKGECKFEVNEPLGV